MRVILFNFFANNIKYQGKLSEKLTIRHLEENIYQRGNIFEELQNATLTSIFQNLIKRLLIRCNHYQHEEFVDRKYRLV